MTPPPHYFLSDRHALYMGWIVGTSMRSGLGVELIMDDDGNYTDRLKVPMGGGRMVEVIVPPPPEDWAFE